MKDKRFRSIQTKIVSITLAVGIISVIMAMLFVSILGKQTIEELTGSNFQELAFETSGRAANYIEHHIEESQFLALSSDVLSVLRERDGSYANRSPADIKNEINKIEVRWQDMGPSHPLLKKILNNRAAEFMRVSNVEGVSEEPIHYVILATDRHGALVAATDKPPHYSYANEDWWKKAYNNGNGRKYIPGITFNKSINEYSFDIITPVKDKGKTIGIILMAHRVDKFFNAITSVHVGRTDHTMLVSSDGTLLFCPVLPIKSHRLTKELTDVVFKDKAGWTPTYADVHYPGKRSLVGFAPIKLTFALPPPNFGGFKWHIITSQNPAETYAPIDTLLRWVAILGFLTVGLLCLFETYLLRKIVMPIKMLCRGAERIGGGDLSYRLDIHSRDEIEELANKFNEMASKLKSSYSRLERKTADLASANKDLAILYTITSTMSQSLKLTEILGKVLKRIPNALGIDAASIYLLDKKGECLSLTAHVGIESRMAKEYSIIKIERFPYPLVIEKAEPFVAAEGLKGNGEIHDAFFKNFNSMACIPLKAKDKVLGALTVYSHERGFFSQRMIDLLVSVGNQLGIAIDNAQLFEETERLGRVKSEFVSHVSHELRTPLSSIKSAAEILLHYDEDREMQKEFLTVINNETDRLARLISEILDLSKIDTDQIKWRFEVIDLKDVINNSMKVVKPLARKTRVSLKTSFPEEPPLVIGDKDRLVEVMTNLLDNAFKFTSKGSITIGVEPYEDGFVKIYVSDTGRGIPQEECSKIFEPFYQCGDLLEDKPRGTGLGLAICKRIVERHKGAIWVESEVGRGSTFYFTLQMAESSIQKGEKVTIH